MTSIGSKTTNKTVDSYVKALNEAYLFYQVARYDVHGKEILKTNPKHYIVDFGLWSYLGGYRMSDMGRRFENAVYLQLIFWGWRIHVGSLYGREIDFVAVRDSRIVYIQVTDVMYSDQTRTRELKALRSIKDSYEKCVIVRQGSYDSDSNGIKILNARDFFLGQNFN